MTGAAERGLLRQGLRYSLGLRVVVVGASSVLSLILELPPNQTVGVAVVLALNVWNLCFAYLLLRAETGRRRRWPAAADVAVMCGVCLTQVWTVSQGPTDGPNWVLVAVEIVLVTYPWQLGSVALAMATLTITAAYLGGAAVPNPGGWFSAGPAQLWTVMEALLSWALYRFLRQGAQAADRVVERGEQLRRAAELAAARRADEREYLAALHDTASASLLMVGAGVVAGRERWFADQAARDLEMVGGSAAARDGEVDLLDLLREVAARTPLRIRWHGAESLRLPATDAVLLSRGMREALTNVVRHAGTGEAEIHVHGDGDTVTVEVVDNGRGFDPKRVSGHHYGVTRSLVERMNASGGSARILSSPGQGTRVRLTYPLPTSRSAVDDGDAGIIATSFHRGLLRAVVVMSLVILLVLDLPKLLTSQDAYRPVWPQFVAWGGLAAVTAAAGSVIWRGRSLGRWRWPLLGLVFALSAMATSVVRPDQRLGPAHWSEGDAGWQVVLLMLDSPIGMLAGALVAQYAMTFAQAAAAGQAALTVLGVVNATWVVLSYQLATAVIAFVLRDLAVSSAKAARATERVRTSEAVARQLHRDRTERYSALAGTTVPLLAGLASGELNPGDESVRRRCAVEAARMRRLFAEDATEPDSLLHELRACTESAERNGVSVSFAECGTRPAVPPAVSRRLTEPAVAALAAARGKVRLTLAGAHGSVTVSVVADCPQHAVPPSSDHDGVDISVLRHGDRLWIKATWQGGPR